MTDPNSTAEQNARMRARADYFRWLLKYYGSVELAEMADEPEPVNLRQIFVPMRLSPEAMDEGRMANPSEVAEQETQATLPGRDAFELISEQTFVCLSGLPGSGKTTLTKALIGELCGSHPSPLRNRLAGRRGIAPIPIILRDIKDWETIDSLDALMNVWWRNLQTQSEQGDELEIERLKHSFSAEGERFQLLLLLDGIDETGGANVREKLLDIAVDAHNKGGYRVVVTGRPSGFEGTTANCLIVPKIENMHGMVSIKPSVDSEVLFPEITANCLHRLQPLFWPQIKTFVDRWYRLRPEWEIKRKTGGEHFLQALQDPNRPHLLTLARRPIFLTLMALVHCTRNEMPHGRADLYEAIVDLYLNRQERHRQLKYGTKGQAFKTWPAQEKRRVLARIAYQSQLWGADEEKADLYPDQRCIVWQQADLLAFIETFLQQRAGSGGIAVEDAAELLEYYLHPAGLLISPRDGEISFAHLSFQEYLCAEDIQRRLSGAKFTQIFRTELVERLDWPGWNEVALLLLAMHKNRSDDGHLELLDLLQFQESHQAQLLVQAVCGKELALTENQQRQRLPALVAVGLLHPYLDLGSQLRDCAHLAEPGLALVIELFKRFGRPESQWRYLLAQISAQAVFDDEYTTSFENALSDWLQPAWRQEDSADVARLESMLTLLTGTGWGLGNEVLNPIASNALADELAGVVKQDLLWRRDKKGVPITTNAGLLLDVILPASGPLWRQTLAALPPDVCLLQGEVVDDNVFSEEPSQPCVLLALNPKECLAPRGRLAVGLYQALILIECLLVFNINDARPLSLSLLLSQSKSRLLSRSLSRSLSRARLRLLSRSQSLLRSQSLSLPWSQLQLQSLQSLDISSVLMNKLTECAQAIDRCPDSAFEAWTKQLEPFCYRHASRDWFAEQAEDSDLMRRRGLRPGEPLPRELGLFDERGLPLPLQDRRHWQKLQAWLQDDDAMLGFWFPEGLSAEHDKQLREDLAIVKCQPWCPQAFIKAALDEWPEDRPYWDFSFETAEREMLTACEALLAAARPEKKDAEPEDLLED